MIKNYITICCQGDQIERFINLCSFHDIWLWNIHKDDNLCYMNLYPEDFFLLKEFVKKTKIRIRTKIKTTIKTDKTEFSKSNSRGRLHNQPRLLHK